MKKKKSLAGLGGTGQEPETKMDNLIVKWVAALADILFPAGAILHYSSFLIYYG